MPSIGCPSIARSDTLSSNSHSELACATRPSGSSTNAATGKVANSSEYSGPAATVMASRRRPLAPGGVEFGEQRRPHARFRLLIHAIAEPGRSRQALGVPADMLARHVDAGL